MTRTGTDRKNSTTMPQKIPDGRDLRHAADPEEEPEDAREDDRDRGGLEGVEQAR